jgi:hypothetical protein
MGRTRSHQLVAPADEEAQQPRVHSSDPSTPRSRRALLAAAAAGVGTLVASRLAAPAAVDAGTDGDVVLGAANTETSVTKITNTNSQDIAISASQPNGRGSAVLGDAYYGYGLHGTTTLGAAVYAQCFDSYGFPGSVAVLGGYGGQAVWAQNNSDSEAAITGWAQGRAAAIVGGNGLGAPVSPTNVGVYGSCANDANSVGVSGASTSGSGVQGTSNQDGVRGQSLGSGAGVRALGTNGPGLAATSPNGSAVEASSPATTSPAILGQSSGHATAVEAFSGGASDTAPAAPGDTGVFGAASADLGTGVLGRGVSTLTSNSVGVLGEGDTGVVGSGGFGVFGASNAPGIGVYGSVSNSVAPSVYGKAGVIGQTDAGGTGVVGFTGLTEHVPPPDTGIYGRSDTGGTNGRGLTGFCSTGIGLLGQTDTGVGVRAYCGNNTGVGLSVIGKAAFARSGKLTISAGHSSLTKTGIGLTSASFILATLQKNVAGLFIQAVVTNPAGSAFTIYLNKAPTVSVVIAWLAVN